MAEADDGTFWQIASGLDQHADEARTRARDELASHRTSFAGRLRRVPTGEVVTLTLSDGAALHGRLLDVGADVVRFGEVTDGRGVSGRRVVRQHEIRLDAVVRLTWEAPP